MPVAELTDKPYSRHESRVQSQSAEIALPELDASQRFFTRASRSFAEASVVHDHARAALLSRLDYFSLDVEICVDLGCGTGGLIRDLSIRWPNARRLGIDRNHSMCRATTTCKDSGKAFVIGGCAERLPLKPGSCDVVLANLLLPWCLPEPVLAEIARVLKPTGVFLFATLGPDTLVEVRRAWGTADDAVHVHAQFDMHDLGDLVAAAGLAEPVLDRELLTLTYADTDTLVRDLRGCGAVNSAAGRRKALTGTGRWRAFEHSLLAGARDGQFQVSVELIYGHAWGGRDSRARPGTGPAETRIPLTDILRR